MLRSSKWQVWTPRDKKAVKQKEHAPDYRRYVFSGREMLLYTAQGAALVLLLAWFFYRSLWAVLPLLLLFPVFLKRIARQLAAKRRQELLLQFKDMILAAAACLQAGYSVENAFLEAGRDMEELYGEKSLIAREAGILRRGIGSSIPLETLLLDLGRRSGEADMEDFAQVFAIARRAGGGMNAVIRRSASATGEKIEVKREIHTFLASRKYEQRIMNLIPFLIVAYLQLTSDGFFDVLYGNPAGILIMTGCLAVYLAAFVLAERIVEIEV